MNIAKSLGEQNPNRIIKRDKQSNWKKQRFYIGNKRIFMTKAEVTNLYH